MTDFPAISVLMLTRHEEAVAGVNSALRDVGLAVHCHWIHSSSELAAALRQVQPELLLFFAEEGLAEITAIIAARDEQAPGVPVVCVRHTLTEALLLEDLTAGAQDTLSYTARGRLQQVCARELKAFRLQRALASTVTSARESQRQLQVLVQGSADAIALVQEGIVVEANAAWLALFNTTAAAIVSAPVMDWFDHACHAAMRGALVACEQGRWEGHTLKTVARVGTDRTLPMDLELASTRFEDAPAVRLSVTAPRQDANELEQRLQLALETDPSTGVLLRQPFVERLRHRLLTSPPGGVRYLAFVRPDRFGEAVAVVGPLVAEELIGPLGSLIRETLAPGDLCGRLSGTGFMVLLERGTARDVEIWAEQLLSQIAARIFHAGERSVSLTASAGLGVVHGGNHDPAGPAADAVEANRQARTAGGNRVLLIDRSDSETRVQSYDQVWVQHIKAALVDNRFRLVQQPVASLLGEDKGMFDVLMRMLDEQGHEVLPSEFMPAAERNDLMKSIDRWVIGASMAFCVKRSPQTVFVRLSLDSVNDATLPAWLQQQLTLHGINPAQLCFQITEAVAGQYLDATKALADTLRTHGFRFALEHFGTTPAAIQILNHLGADFVKIDGTLMQGLASSVEQQDKVQALVQAARINQAATIAERVGDANTMAVLWQLGIQFIQGYLLHKPEEVILG